MHFIDLHAQREQIKDQINAAVAEVIESGQFILGPKVDQFEKALCDFGQAKHAIGCANGTDALALPLLAWQLSRGDAVFCPSFTFCATAEVVPWFGATPVFVDIDKDYYTIDPEKLEESILKIKSNGKLTPKVIIAVDLFGQPCDYPKIQAIAKKYDLKLIADSAQGFGCTLDNKHPLHWADVTTTSFFPAKPLGCYGDGGAVLTNDDELAKSIRSLHMHGAGQNKYDNIAIGMNSRLDTIQAAILIEKLEIFPNEIERRNDIVNEYNYGLTDFVERIPKVIKGGQSVWAQYTIEHANRDSLQSHLKSKGIPSVVYYPLGLHLQSAYKEFPAPVSLEVTEEKSKTVLSLPMHPYLTDEIQTQIMSAAQAFELS